MLKNPERSHLNNSDPLSSPNGIIELTNKNNLQTTTTASTSKTSMDNARRRSSMMEAVPQERTPRPIKQIRFDLNPSYRSPDTPRSSSDLETTLTPPPKEFKRSLQRKTLRSARCMSTVVTEKELALLHRNRVVRSDEKIDSPRIPTGIVQSMCKIYSGGVRLTGRSLNRSSSFSSPSEAREAKAKMRDEENKENVLEVSVSPNLPSSSESSPNSESGQVPRKGSLRLFRSRSWSLQKKKDGDSKEGNVNDPKEEKRSSPSCSSTKSQDSGFSDSGESNNGNGNSSPKVAAAVIGSSGENSPKTTSSQEPSPTCLGTKKKSNSPHHTSTNGDAVPDKPLEKVENAISNIASMQEGLRLKRQQCEEGDVETAQNHLRSSNLLIRPTDFEEEDKARKQFYFSEIRRFQEEQRMARLNANSADTSQLSLQQDDGIPVFSTPVRASFRRRPRTMIEEAKTPSKVDSRLRLREMKSRSAERNNRRWSNLELEQQQIHQQQSTYVPSVYERSDIPTGIDPSLVAVWSRFLDYEATPIDIRNRRDLTQLSCDETGYTANATGLSQMQSLAADGTDTRLMMESYNERAAAFKMSTGVEQSTLLSCENNRDTSAAAIIELDPSDFSVLHCGDVTPTNSSSPSSSPSNGSRGGRRPGRDQDHRQQRQSRESR